MNTPFSRRSLRPLLLIAALGACTPAFAQPGFGDGPNDGAPNDGGPNGGGPGQNNNRPPQPRGDMGQMRERMLKRQLENAGYTDQKLQETIVAYLKDRETARQPLNKAAGELSQQLMKPDASSKEIDAAIATFNAALDAERTRTKKAEKELNAQIKYSSDAKLETILTLNGVIGDAGSYLAPRGPGGRMGGPNDGPPQGGPGGGPPDEMDGPM